jgi:very-short-patch-repair endonuclease
MEESEIRQSITPEKEKFDGIILELGRRGIVVLMNRPTRWGYVVDAVIPSTKVVVLKMPDLSRHKVAMNTFQDFTDRLESDGYRVLVVPKKTMNEEQIKVFCDRISKEPSLAAA